MALIILIILTALIALAALWRGRRAWFAALLGAITFLFATLWMTSDVPFPTMFRLVISGAFNWLIVIAFVAGAAVYGAIGLVVHAYTRGSLDTRRVQVFFSALFGAIISGLIYLAFTSLVLPSLQLPYSALATGLATGALVGLVVSFALTSRRPPGCSFFESRDGGTVLAALLGGVVNMGGLNIVMQELPGPSGVKVVVVNLMIGALLGAGLTIPLRAIRAGRLARAVLGAVIACLVLTAMFQSRTGAPILAGLAVGAVVGALLPEEPCEEGETHTVEGE